MNFNLTDGCSRQYLSNTCEVFFFFFWSVPAKFLKYKSLENFHLNDRDLEQLIVVSIDGSDQCPQRKLLSCFA